MGDDTFRSVLRGERWAQGKGYQKTQAINLRSGEWQGDRHYAPAQEAVRTWGPWTCMWKMGSRKNQCFQLALRKAGGALEMGEGGASMEEGEKLSVGQRLLEVP